MQHNSGLDLPTFGTDSITVLHMVALVPSSYKGSADIDRMIGGLDIALQALHKLAILLLHHSCQAL